MDQFEFSFKSQNYVEKGNGKGQDVPNPPKVIIHPISRRSLQMKKASWILIIEELTTTYNIKTRHNNSKQ